MDPVVAAAWIATGAAVVGVAGTATVGIVGFRISRSTNQATIDAAKDNTDKTVAAAHADILSTLEATRDGQFADRYSRAIEQLGSDNLDIRVGGIYALEGIAQDSSARHPTVMEVLAAFIRQHSREQWPLPASKDAAVPERATRPDVQAAVTVIGRRNAVHDRRPVDLRGAELYGANLVEADLKDAWLNYVNLRDANLHHASFAGAFLYKANLTHAFLFGANLTYAQLVNANLTRANLRDADLTGAHLAGADFTDTELNDATLYNVTLTAQEFGDKIVSTRPDLTGPNVIHAIFTCADLDHAKWSEEVPAPQGWQRRDSGMLMRAAGDGDETGN